MRLSFQKKTTLFIFSFIATSALILGLVVWPAFDHIRDLREQTYNLRLYLEKKYERSERLHNSLATIQELKVTTANYPHYVFTKGSELKLITMLEDAATAEHVTQNVDSSNFDVAPGNYADFAMTITGTYRDVLNYLHDLEVKVPYFISVKNLTLSPTLNRQNLSATGPDNVSLHLDLRLYVQ